MVGPHKQVGACPRGPGQEALVHPVAGSLQMVNSAFFPPDALGQNGGSCGIPSLFRVSFKMLLVGGSQQVN